MLGGGNARRNRDHPSLRRVFGQRIEVGGDGGFQWREVALLARGDVARVVAQVEPVHVRGGDEPPVVRAEEERDLDGGGLQLTPEGFAPQAQRRVRLGLLIGELVRTRGLAPRQDQIRRRLEEMAQSYEKPAEVIQWYLGNRQRLAEVETMVMEDNVVDWVLQQAKVAEKPVAFDELMGSNLG